MPEDPLKKTFGRLLVSYFDREGFNTLFSLHPTMRVFVYYLYRAAAAGYRVALFQLCPFPHLLDTIHNLLKTISRKDQFYEELASWWVYLYANMGVHCTRETENNKKVPSDMGLDLVTKESLQKLGLNLDEEEWRYLFDKSYFPTATVPSDIEHSGVAFYSKGYTQSMYAKLSQEERDCLIAYHTPEGMKTYCTHGVCAKELNEVVKWLRLALAWYRQSIHLDSSTSVEESLETLIQSFESGKESDFKEHSRIWLKMKNKVEFCFGFIEYYDDPMFHIGTFQADVTIKSYDISSLLSKIPSFEKRFPFPQEYKRKDMSSLPNASPANKIIGMGSLGPVFSTLAYCLPNYSDIRSELGSKQVIYPAPSPPDILRYTAIYFDKQEREILEKHSPDLSLENVVSTLCTTLHETIGHASGNMIEGITEKVRNERLGRWGNGLEEMRAEILALYCVFKFYDEIVDSGFLGKWPNIVSKEVILRFALDHVAGGGWRRWRGLPSGSISLSQAHAIADTGIMYFLVDHCPQNLSLIQDTLSLPEEEALSVLRLRIGNVDQIFPEIENLAQTVQKMSSTSDSKLVNDFMKEYAASTRNPCYGDIVTRMRDALNHGIIHTVTVFPEFELVLEKEKVIDARPMIPSNPLNHFCNIFELSRPDSSFTLNSSSHCDE